MTETLLETHPLANGTTLRLYDVSRRQGADRWIVVLEARLEIPVTHAVLAPDPMNAVSLETLRQVLGSPVVYISRKERVFVDGDDKNRLLQAFRDDYHKTALPYLAHPAFPARYILKQYQETCRRRAWQQASADPDASAS